MTNLQIASIFDSQPCKLPLHYNEISISRRNLFYLILFFEDFQSTEFVQFEHVFIFYEHMK